MPKITAIKLNCQSHSGTVIELSPGLNVIVAPNNTGKSVLLKILKETAFPGYYDREERKNLITWGKECADVTYVFDDDSWAQVKVYVDKTIYYYTPNYKEVKPIGSLEPPQELLKSLGLIVDSKGFIANIIDLDQELFLVDSNAATNQNMLELLTNDERLNRIIETTKAKIKEYNDHLKYLSNVVVDLEYQFNNSSFIDTHELERKASVFEDCLGPYETLLNVYREISRNKGYVTDIHKINFLIECCELTETLEKVEDLLKIETVDYNPDLLEFLEVHDTLTEISNLLDSVGVVEDNSWYEDIITLTDVYFLISDTQISNFDNDLLEFCDALEVLEQVLEASTLLQQYIAEDRNVKERIDTITYRLNEIGKEVACPIYGKVTHVDGECIPKDNRSA